MKTKTFPRTHISLYVSDLAKTVDFYTSFFDRKADKVKPSYAKYTLETPALIISFIENPERVQANFGHLGFQVATKMEMETLLEVAKARNIVAKEEMGTRCCYALQDKFWVSDPDGVQWEIYYFHKDADFNDPHYETREAAVCCAPLQESDQQQALVQTVCETDNCFC